jgi:hypothetical protein
VSALYEPLFVEIHALYTQRFFSDAIQELQTTPSNESTVSNAERLDTLVRAIIDAHQAHQAIIHSHDFEVPAFTALAKVLCSDAQLGLAAYRNEDRPPKKLTIPLVVQGESFDRADCLIRGAYDCARTLAPPVSLRFLPLRSPSL